MSWAKHGSWLDSDAFASSDSPTSMSAFDRFSPDQDERVGTRNAAQ